LSFTSFSEHVEGDQTRRNFEDYVMFLLSEDPLIFFRCLHLGIFLKSHNLKSALFRKTSGLNDILSPNYPEKTIECAIEHTSEYYKWLYLFATDGEGIFECVISSLWPKNFAERREPPDNFA